MAVPVLAQDVDGFGHHHGALHLRHRLAEAARGSPTAPCIAFSSDSGMHVVNVQRDFIASLSAVRKLLPHPLLPSCDKEIQRPHLQRFEEPSGAPDDEQPLP